MRLLFSDAPRGGYAGQHREKTCALNKNRNIFLNSPEKISVVRELASAVDKIWHGCMARSKFYWYNPIIITLQIFYEAFSSFRSARFFMPILSIFISPPHTLIKHKKGFSRLRRIFNEIFFVSNSCDASRTPVAKWRYIFIPARCFISNPFSEVTVKKFRR